METNKHKEKSRNDLETIFMLKDEMIIGTIYVDRNIGIGNYFNKISELRSFIPVYRVTSQSLEEQTILLKKSNIDWMSPNVESEPLRDCIIEGDYNPIKVSIKLQHQTFMGELDLGNYTRLSDRLNDLSTNIIPLLNVEYRNFKRTIFINSDSILSVLER